MVDTGRTTPKPSIPAFSVSPATTPALIMLYHIHLKGDVPCLRIVSVTAIIIISCHLCASCLHGIIYAAFDHAGMVMPLVDEDKPKCYLCHTDFDSMEDLRAHQHDKHADIVPAETGMKKEAVQGDVTLF